MDGEILAYVLITFTEGLGPQIVRRWVDLLKAFSIDPVGGDQFYREARPLDGVIFVYDRGFHS